MTKPISQFFLSLWRDDFLPSPSRMFTRIRDPPRLKYKRVVEIVGRLPPLSGHGDRAPLALKKILLLFNGRVEAKGRKGGDKRAAKPSRRGRWDNGKGWRGEKERGGEDVGRKVW